MTNYTTKIEKTLSLDEARKQAKELANETGKPQPVYKIEELETVQPDWVKGAWYYGEDKKTDQTWICRLGGIKEIFFEYTELYRSLGNYVFYMADKVVPLSKIKGLATPEQIEAHLSAAAIKMGFKEGVKVKTEGYGFTGTLTGGFTYRIEFDTLFFGAIPIYEGATKNKWATILSDSEVVQEPAKNAPNPVLLTYRDEQGTLINIRATEVKINPLEGE